MREKQAIRVRRELTPEQQKHRREVHEQVESEQDEIIAQGRELKREHDRATAALRETFRLLREERCAQGITLRELADRTGISPGALSRLENDPDPNPTIRTIQRYAAALGRQLTVTLETGP
jgi:DNA-binding XRE family transcriptional regulator